MKLINEAAPSTPLLKSYQKHLEQREKDLSGKPEKGADNVLSIMTDGRKAAIDLRFINPHLPDDPSSKLNLGVNVINNVYTRFEKEGYTCAVFFDKARSFKKDGSGEVLFDGIKDMKEKLIKLGVKPEEIGDVRDCKNFGERRRLFEKVNDGKVRVIFGSTDLMGAGTNFQTKLKAIVHVDAPWRPRDIEQQNGRGYRPGNKTGELEVYNLVTKGSLDTGLWNVLDTKAKSIRQVMDGSDKTTREIEDSFYGSVKELSIDNDLMKEAVDLDHSLKKLKSMKKSHESQISHAQRQLSVLPKSIEADKLTIAKVKADIALREPEKKGKEFEISLNGSVVKERKAAGEQILSAARKAFAQAKMDKDNGEIEIGKYSGLTLSVRSSIYDGTSIAKLQAKGTNFAYRVNIMDDSNPVGLITSLHHQIYNTMDKRIEELERTIHSKNSNLTEFKNLAVSEFPKEEELYTKQKRYNEVMELLKKESEKEQSHENDVSYFPWNNLDSMGAEEIQERVGSFNAQFDIVKIEKKIETIEDLKQAILDKHSISIPETILSKIASGFESGEYNDIADKISSSIENVSSNLYRWKLSENTDNIPCVYTCKNQSEYPGSIKIVESGKEFDAYREIDGHPPKLLGSDVSLEKLKARAENFVKTVHIKKDIVNEIVDKQVNNLKGFTQQLSLHIPDKNWGKVGKALVEGKTVKQFEDYFENLAYETKQSITKTPQKGMHL